MPQTKVNLKHLLEDIRDSYPCTVEKAIVTELVANSLDSGASEIRFELEGPNRVLSVVDNGQAMSKRSFCSYHDIASTTKQRGMGIGFAGVGVKLALLQAEKVITETRSKKSHLATTWRLRSPSSAPWRFIKPEDKVRTPTGTAVSIHLDKADGSLLDPRFIKCVIRDEFYPLLHEQFMTAVLRDIYWQGVSFHVNGSRVVTDESGNGGNFFVLRLGQRRKIAGYGFVQKFDHDLPEDKRGIAVSTFGKVIKRGWDWIDIMPKNPWKLSGIVEVPELSKIITTNKMDFLKDANSLQKYYRCRKAIQQAIRPILAEMGEISEHADRPRADFRPVEKQIARALRSMLGEFPELNPLLGRRKPDQPVAVAVRDPAGEPVGVEVEGAESGGPSAAEATEEGGRHKQLEGGLFGKHVEPSGRPTETGRLREGLRKHIGLTIQFEDADDPDQIGRLAENTVFVNKNHAAFGKTAANRDARAYHVALAVAVVLSGYLEGKKSVQAFISNFMANWAQ